MAKLRIGALPDDRSVKRTIILTAAQDNLLRDYAAAIAVQDGLKDAPPVEKLVPAIVERFITTDRGFRSRKEKSTGVSETVNHSGATHDETSGDTSTKNRPTI